MGNTPTTFDLLTLSYKGDRLERRLSARDINIWRWQSRDWH